MKRINSNDIIEKLSNLLNNQEEVFSWFKDNQENVDWDCISRYQTLSESFIREFEDRVDWNWISQYRTLSESFIRKFKDRVNWHRISIYQTLSESFIREFKDRVDWYYISKYQTLSESFIRKFKNKVRWDWISQYQTLSEDFIREFKDRVDWNWISKYQKIPDDLIKDLNIEIPETCWLYKGIEFKHNYVKTCTNYEIVGDYVYAYKSARIDGTSVFDHRYKYETGKTYETRADYNIDEDSSFGFSAWTLDGAKEYYPDGKIFKVRIHLNDLAAVVHENSKLRCCKIEILEEV